MAYDAGEAFLQIVPSFRGVVEAIDAEATKWGAAAGSRFAESFRAKLAEDLRGLDVRLGANTAEAEAKLAELRAEIDRIARESPDVRVKADTAEAEAKLAAVAAAEKHVGDSAGSAQKPVFGLIGAIAAVAPAAVPIAGVAGGAFLGLIPVVATLGLGIKGIADGMKDGSLQASQYGGDITALKNEFTQLKTIATAGLLAGFDTAMKSSGPLFKEVNSDVKTMSSQLGDIAGTVAPALVSLLHQLNPLFVTFGQLIDTGAHKLAGFASSGTGVSSFVAYVQAELPHVLQFFGELATLISHVVQAAAPFGGVMLGEIGLLIRALNAIPVSVLQDLVPAAVAVYAAFKGYALISSLVNGVSAAIASMTAPFAGSAAAATAASLATQAAVADEAAAVALAKADEAAAAADAAVEIAAAVEGTSSILAEGASAAAEAAIEFAAAMQAEADAAAASAAKIALAATAAAETVAAEGKTASIGWAGLLGPVGALAIGVGILSGAFFHNSDGAQAAAAAANSYAQSVQTSTDALSAANIQQTNKNLADKGSLSTLADLTSANKGLGISNLDLALAVNGTDEQYNSLISKLQAVPALQTLNRNSSRDQQEAMLANNKSVQDLVGTLGTLRKGLQDQILTQTQLNQLNAASIGITDAQAVAAAKLYGLTGDQGVAAYLAAQKAAEKNTNQTTSQTLAFQLENNAAALVNQALQTLAGQHLSDAQAQTALDQATLTLTSSLKTNGATIADNTSKGIANRQAIEGAISALQAKLQADAAATGSTEKATAQYKTNSTALLEQIGKIDGTTSAAYKYAASLLKIPPIVKTDAELKTDAATAALRAYQAEISKIPHYYETQMQLNITENINKIDAGSAGHHAAGGYITGPGSGTSDSIPEWLSNGEFVINAAATEKYRPMLEAINQGKSYSPSDAGRVSAAHAIPDSGIVGTAAYLEQIARNTAHLEMYAPATAAGLSAIDGLHTVMVGASS